MLPAPPPSRATSAGSPDPVLLWVRDGRARVRVDGRPEQAVEAGELIRIPAGVPHRIDTERGTAAVPIQLSGTGDAALPEHPIRVPPGWDPHLAHMFALSLGFLRDSAGGVGLLDLIPHPGADEPAPPPLPRTPEAFALAHRLVRDPGSVVELPELAAEVGISPRTVQRRFRAETGLTFSAWRTRVRIAAAMAYLAADWPVGRVATEVGFESASSFTRTFRELTGTTPRQYSARSDRTPPRPGLLTGTPPPVPAAGTWQRVNGSHVAVWVFHGTASATVGGHRWRLSVGDALVLPAGISTQVETDPDSVLLPLGFRTAIGAPISAEEVAPTRFAPELTTRLLHGLVATYTALRPARHREAELFDLVARRSVSGAATPDPLAEVAAHLARTPTDRTGLHEWAVRLDTDPRRLAAAFRQATGTDFGRWRRLSRMTRGRELLMRGLTPTAVSRHLGYAHVSAFSRAFRAAYGMPPGRFRAQLDRAEVAVRPPAVGVHAPTQPGTRAMTSPGTRAP